MDQWKVGIIKKNWLQFYDEAELFSSIENGEIKVDCILQSWDTANKVTENNDYSACITILRDTKGVNYVLNVYRDKLEFPALIKKIAQKYETEKEKYKKKVIILIEDQASGTSLIQTLKKDYRIYPVGIKPEYDKETRLMAVSHLIENGSCLFPNEKPHWWMDFEQELLRFPKGKHDDQCDALSQALQHKGTYSVPRVVTRCRRRAPSLLQGFGFD